MAIAVVAIIVGLAVLIKSSDVFVAGAATIAQSIGVSPLLIGIVIIGFGTSLPELLVSVFAAVQDSPGIAIGNAYGSNIANIALILGLGAVITPIVMSRQLLRRDLPLEFIVIAVSAAVIYDGKLSRLDGLLLLLAFGALLFITVRGSEIIENNDGITEEDIAPNASLKATFIRTAAGLIALMISSYLLVFGATTIAKFFGVSDLIIGLTVVAIGTSLPELASSIAAVRRHEYDLAVGNIMGSFLFNSLLIVGTAAVVRPFEIERGVLTRDFPLMAFLLALLLVMGLNLRRRPAEDGSISFWRNGVVNRVEGAFLVIIYISYTVYLFSTAKAG